MKGGEDERLTDWFGSLLTLGLLQIPQEEPTKKESCGGAVCELWMDEARRTHPHTHTHPRSSASSWLKLPLL